MQSIYWFIKRNKWNLALNRGNSWSVTYPKCICWIPRHPFVFCAINILSHCRGKQLKCLPSYFRGASVTACLSWSCWDLYMHITHADTHTHTHTHTPIECLSYCRSQKRKLILLYSIVDDASNAANPQSSLHWDDKTGCYCSNFDSEFSHIPQRRIKSINISSPGQIRCALMKDLDKSECVRPVLSSHTGTARP